MVPVNYDNRFLMFGVRVEKMYDTIIFDCAAQALITFGQLC